ncbi:TonB-dependent receptor [Altererythrobacter sp. CC-YST694]|uniref:TonB-dependent receptor n=1 Tax=Altererythrobacter sp. CC-YST694 TaxID=2755038 RepID=UPI001D024CA9|nr:TonB-dependent receptor [Altererythrobacter sp. CC-YST694]MCB5425696.1 TonB-dependent receptor [Altererythrobacter sp. CC-YST694]
MKNNLHLRTTMVLGASMLAIGIASPAAAQSDQDNTTGNNDIIVTAQFREQNLQDTPLAITAVTAETMEAKSQTNLAQVADSAPNVTLKPQGASFGPSIAVSIRGIGGADFNPAFEPGVGIYIDDVYYPQLTGAVFDLLDLERVEILRGPQGTLSGRNSEGGSIKMFTRRPQGSNTGYMEATYGSRNRIGLRGGFDFKLTDDLSGRVSGVYKHQEGYVERYDFGCVYPAGGSATFKANDGTTKLVNPAGGIPALKPQGSCLIDKLGEVGYQAVRGALRYNPSSDIDINLSAEYIHDSHTAAGEVLAATDVIDNPNTNIGGVPYDNRFICGKFCNFSSYSSPAITYFGVATPPTGQPLLATQNSDQSVYSGYNLAANFHFALSDTISIDNILAYQAWDTTFGVDDDLSPIPLSGGYNSLTHWNWSEELRLNAQLADNITAVLGGYYFKQRTDYYSYQDLRYLNVAPGVGLFPLQFIQPDETPAEAKAVFANVSWEITPGLTFDGGIRYTDESKEYRYFRLNPDGTINPYLDPVGAVNGAGTPGALTGLVASYKGQRWDWRAALNYRFSPELMVYGSVATGFKGGGTNPRPFYASQAISFAPEVLTNYEVGMKADLFDRMLRLNLNAFYGKLSDLQIGVSVCPDGTTPCAALVNAGNAEEKGVEAEFTLRPTEGFSIDGSVSYLDFKYTKLDPSVSGTSLDDPLAGAPKWKWALGAQYEIDAGSFGSITPRIDASYQSEVYTGAKYNGVPQNIDAYTIVNARLTWQNPDKDLSISLEVTNLTDEYYYVTLFDLREAGAGLDKAQPGRPREWAVSVKKTF